MNNVFVYLASIAFFIFLLRWLVDFISLKIKNTIQINYVQLLMTDPGDTVFKNAINYEHLVELGQDTLWKNANILVDDLLDIPNSNIIQIKDRTFPALLTIHKTVMILAAAKRGLIQFKYKDEIQEKQPGDPPESAGPSN